jgi:hypothetical protein
MPSDQTSAEQPVGESLNKVIAEFDAKPSAFGEFEVVDKMRSALGDGPLSEEDRSLYYGESNAFFFRGRMQEDDPFPGYFQPTIGFPRSDGTTSWTPDPADLTPAMTARWKKHLESCQHAILRARYADLLWSFQRSVEGVGASVSTAHVAIDAYLDASRLGQAKEMNTVVWLARAVGLAASISDSIRLDAAVQRCLDWVQANGKPNLPGTWTFLFDEVYENRRVDEADKAKVISFLESVLAATADQTAQTFDHLSAIVVSERLAKHFRREGNRTEEERVIRTAGLATEYAASNVTPLLALGWLQPLMERYRDVGMIEDAERVQVESRRRGANSRDDMKTKSYAFQIPREAIDGYLNWLCEPKESTVRLRRWATSNVNDVDDANKALLDGLTQTPLLARIGVTAINAGQFVAKAGSVEDDLDGRLAMQLRQLIEMRFNLFVGGWQRLIENGAISETILMNTFKDSPVFDAEGIALIEAGIQRFFKEDHLAATHILIPQVERALRTTLGLLGRPTNKIVRGEKGVMQEQNMNDALADPAIKQLLPKNFQHHLQIVFSSRLGFNLRNLIAHGILPCSQFSILTSLLALQGLLLLSQIESAKE